MHRPAAPPVHRVPPFRMISFLKPGDDSETVVLSDRQREELAYIGTRVRLPARMTIYRAQSPAQWVFAVADGVVKSYRELPSGRRHVALFLFPRDLFGLAANGLYVNSAQAITRVTLYRFPVNALAVLLKRDGDMQFAFLAKVTHELRESQRRAILLNRRDAAGRLATFIARMDERLNGRATGTCTVDMPMTRSDIAGFLGLSLETVSRAAADLERRGLVKFETRHFVRIVDPAGLARLVAAI